MMDGMSMGMSRGLRAVAAIGAAGLVMAGCGGGETGSDGRFTIVTGVYPLEWLATEIGGDAVDVVNLTEPGAEPHDLELTPRQVGEVSKAGLALYVKGMQPAVDQAIEQQAGDRAFDVADVVELREISGEHGEEHGHEHGGEEHGHEHGGEHGGEEHGGKDPHMWLDPERMAETAEALGDRLAEADPDHAETYRTNTEKVTGELADIDSAYADGLKGCAKKEFVVSHAAFGYIADAYGLTQIGITGIEPDTEPSPARMGEIATLVKEKGVDTVFTETLVSPDVAETIAAESGAKTAVLDPIEGITDRSPGTDYPSIMRANLTALQGALDCP